MMPDSHPITDAITLPALSQFDFHSRMADFRGATLVAFTSPGCGACRHLRLVLQQLRREEPDWRVFEVDAQREQALTNEFEVFHLPTIFLFLDGQYHCQLRAEARPGSILSATHAALQQPAEEAP
jgi:thioredoxin 1